MVVFMETIIARFSSRATASKIGTSSAKARLHVQCLIHRGMAYRKTRVVLGAKLQLLRRKRD